MEYLFGVAMFVVIGLFAAYAAFVTGNWWVLVLAVTALLGAYIPYSFWRDNKELDKELEEADRLDQLDRISGENHA